MLYEFQIIYRRLEGADDGQDGRPPDGREPLEVIRVRAESESSAIALLERCPGVKVEAASMLEPVIPENKFLTREEAAAYLRCGPTLITTMQADGRLPRATSGNPLYTRAQLDAVIAKRMRVAAEELRAA